MKRNPELPVPFAINGDLLHDPNSKESTVGAWRPNRAFEATIRLKGTKRGRSAAFFQWENVETGAIYPMFITDVGHLLMQGQKVAPGGVASGRWFVVKRGANYGITPEHPREDQEAPSGATEAHSSS